MTQLQPFGPGTAWLAVLDRTQMDVTEALGLTGPRMVPCEEAVAATSGTGMLPPLPGVDGRWTLAVSVGLADISTTRLTSLSALLSTRVQAFVTHRGADGLRWLEADRGRLVRPTDTQDASAIDADAVLDVARDWSIDPRSLDGVVQGPIYLFDDVDEGPPEREALPRAARPSWWRWLRPGGATIAPRDHT